MSMYNSFAMGYPFWPIMRPLGKGAIHPIRSDHYHPPSGETVVGLRLAQFGQRLELHRDQCYEANNGQHSQESSHQCPPFCSRP